MSPPPRLLAVAPSWLGDAVLALPALALLQSAGVEVEVLARQGTERVFADTVPAAQVHPVSSTSRWRRLRSVLGLRRRGYAAAVVLPPSFSAALLAGASGAPVRLGARQSGRSWLLTHGVQPVGRSVHLAEGYLRLARAALQALGRGGAEAAPPPASPWPRLQATSEERAAAATLLRSHALPPEAAALVVAPGARYGAAKRWPAERFAAAAAQAATFLEAPVVLVGGREDANATAAVHAALPAAVDLAGRTPLPTLLGLLAGARGVLSNDSGVMHLAAALGAPVVGIFGSTNPEWTRPLGPRAAVVVHPVPCAPCYLRRCPIDFPCMHGIAPEHVVATLRRLLAAARPGVAEAISRV